MVQEIMTALNYMEFEMRNETLRIRNIWDFLNVLAHKESIGSKRHVEFDPGSGRSQQEDRQPFPRYSCPTDMNPTWLAIGTGSQSVRHG